MFFDAGERQLPVVATWERWVGGGTKGENNAHQNNENDHNDTEKDDAENEKQDHAENDNAELRTTMLGMMMMKITWNVSDDESPLLRHCHQLAW